MNQNTFEDVYSNQSDDENSPTFDLLDPNHNPEESSRDIIDKEKYLFWEERVKNRKNYSQLSQMMRGIENSKRHQTIRDLLAQFTFPKQIKLILNKFDGKQKSLQWFFIHMSLFVHHPSLQAEKVKFLKHFLNFMQQLRKKIGEDSYLLFCMAEYYIAALSCLTNFNNDPRYSITNSLDILYRVNTTKNNMRKKNREECLKLYLELPSMNYSQ